MELNSILTADNSGTRTLAMARAMFRASWDYNDGRRVDDIPFFDDLPDAGKQVLMDSCAAAEVLLSEFGNEDERLVLGNLAWTLFDAYHAHPFCSEPHHPFDKAPDDMKALWVKYARAVLDAFYANKYLPSSGHFTTIEVSKR